MQREAIYTALVDQLSALKSGPNPSVVVVSRGFVVWDTADQQPAIYIVPVREVAQYSRGVPTKWTVHVELYVYVRWTDSVSAGVTQLSAVLDAIDNVLSPLGPNASPRAGLSVNTLGGLADYCAIQGAVEISAGFLSKSQTVARVPLEIVVAG